jgi:hypothetical protein
VLQTYGGELLLRAYLFALPPAAFFAATLFYPSPSSGRSWKTSAAIGLASVALLGGFLFTRYGNEKTDYFTRNEVEAIQHLYEIAKPGSLIIAGTHSLPWKFQDYEKYRYQRAEEAILTANMDEIEQLMASRKRTTAYLILTRSQKANAELFSGLPPAKWKQFEEQLRDSGRFQLIYANQDASIFTLAPGRHR